jgi:hypothetical protein
MSSALGESDLWLEKASGFVMADRCRRPTTQILWKASTTKDARRNAKAQLEEQKLSGRSPAVKSVQLALSVSESPC